MRIAIAQMNPTVGDIPANLATALEYAQLAVRGGADLIIYPEGALTGAPLDGILSSRAFCEQARAAVESFAGGCSLPSVIGSALWQDDTSDGRMAAFLCQEGRSTPLVSTTGAVPAFYADKRLFAVFTDGLASFDREGGAPDCIIDLQATAYRGLESIPFSSESATPAKQATIPTNAFLLHANLVGAQDSVVYPGGSFVMNPEGEFLTIGHLFAANVIFADILDDAEQAKPVSTPTLDINELDYKALVLAVHDYFVKNHLTDAVLGISGGIDSALTAAIATDALGVGHVHGVLMPSRHSSAGSLTDAQALASNLSMETDTVPIKKTHETVSQALKDACEGRLEGVADENTQARLRTVYLMAIANTFDWVLLNTGNKSEAAMGFSTLYGDTAGAFAPLGDVYKTHVYDLAEWRNRQGKVIPREILAKAPSAELYDGAKDSDRLPEYDKLDKVLAAHVEGGMGLEELVAAGFDRSLCEEVLRKVTAFEFKRRQEPIAPEISSVSFTQRAWPITNRFVDKA